MKPSLLIDVTRLYYRQLREKPVTGIDRVGLEYVRHYSAGAQAVLSLGGFQSVLSPGGSEKLFGRLLDPKRPSDHLAAACKAYVDWWGKPDVSGKILLDTSQMALDRVGQRQPLLRRGARPVFFIHDLIPLTHPEYCRPDEDARHAARMRAALMAGRGIIVNSQATRDELSRFAAKEGLRVPRTVVAPLATSLPFGDRGEPPLPGTYFVILGTIEPRKNHRLLLQIWRRFAQQLGDAAPRLVVIGQRGWECENIVDLLERCPELQGRVIEHSNLDDVELTALLRHARGLLFPSFAEGFGIPLAEALSLGVPVIASDLAVFREVSGEVPDYAHPLDGRRWMELILDYASPQSAARAAQLERIGRFKPATWQEHFQKVDAFLSTL